MFLSSAFLLHAAAWRWHKGRGVHIVPTSMHNRCRLSLSVFGGLYACVVETCSFQVRKIVHIRTKQHRRARSIMEDTNDAMAADIAMDDEIVESV